MTDTVAERLCVYNLPCGADNDFFYFIFFGSGSTVLTTDILSPDSHLKTVLLKCKHQHLCITF